jgi:hypothetical protein
VAPEVDQAFDDAAHGEPFVQRLRGHAFDRLVARVIAAAFLVVFDGPKV